MHRAPADPRAAAVQGRLRGQILRKHLDILAAAASAGAFFLEVSPFYVIVGAAIGAIIVFKTEAAQTPVGTRAAAPLPTTHIVALPLALVIGLFCLYLASTKCLTLTLAPPLSLLLLR